MSTKEGIDASCATYRTATNTVAKQLKIDPEHTTHPSDDFQEIAELIPEMQKEKALQWYEMGIKRGMINATNMMLDGTLKLNDGTLYCPENIKVRVKTRFAGEDWKKQKFEFKAEEIGFE